MKRFSEGDKILIYLSCIMPLFIIYLLQALYIGLEPKIFKNEECEYIIDTISKAYYIGIILVLILLVIFGFSGIKNFEDNFLENKNLPGEIKCLLEAEDLTPEYYFNYFSFFVIAFANVKVYDYSNMIITFAVLVLMMFVYTKNNMYYINPTLNLLGYRMYKIKYTSAREDESKSEDKDKAEENDVRSLIVISKDNLQDEIGENIGLKQNVYDYSIVDLHKKD